MIIKSKAGNGNKVHVYIDNEYVLTVYDDFWFQFGFKDGETVTEEEVAEKKKEIEELKAKLNTQDSNT